MWEGVRFLGLIPRVRAIGPTPVDCFRDVRAETNEKQNMRIATNFIQCSLHVQQTYDLIISRFGERNLDGKHVVELNITNKLNMTVFKVPSPLLADGISGNFSKY